MQGSNNQGNKVYRLVISGLEEKISRANDDVAKKTLARQNRIESVASALSPGGNKVPGFDTGQNNNNNNNSTNTGTPELMSVLEQSRSVENQNKSQSSYTHMKTPQNLQSQQQKSVNSNNNSSQTFEQLQKLSLAEQFTNATRNFNNAQLENQSERTQRSITHSYDNKNQSQKNAEEAQRLKAQAAQLSAGLETLCQEVDEYLRTSQHEELQKQLTAARKTHEAFAYDSHNNKIMQYTVAINSLEKLLQPLQKKEQKKLTKK